MNLVNLIPMRPKQVAPKFGANQASARVLIAQGQGSVEKNPDTMTVHLSLREEGAEKKTVFRTLADKAKALMDSIKSLAFPLKTQPNLSVNEKYRYDQKKGQQLSDGFHGSYVLTLTDNGDDPTVFAEHAAQITEVAEKHEANIQGPGFSLSPVKYREAEREADGEGYKDARAVAENVAKAGNFAIANEPVEVKVGYVQEYQPRGHAMRAMAASADFAEGAAAPNSVSSEIFDFKPITVNSKPIQAVFEIVPKKKSNIKE